MAMNVYVDDDMMCEGLFDNIEDLLDFSTDDDEVLVMGDSAPSGGSGGGGDGGALQMSSAVTAPTASFPSSEGEGCRVTATSDETKICDEINIHEDWITNFLDDSNFDIDFPAAANDGIIAAAAPPGSDYVGNGGADDDSLFRSFSPVSVLDEPNNLSSNDKGGSSSSSSSSSSTSSSRTNGTAADTVSLALAPVGPTMMLVPARARSKRPRRAAPAPAHVAVPIVPPASDGPPAVPTLLPECESFGESEPCAALPPTKKNMKKNRQNFLVGNAGGGDDATAVRKCQHCGIHKTPQWRAGPTGPKTLCNACGVRYKSGRLFPEYRPAASPTFVPTVHSNSHKKVVEMRIKACQQKAGKGTPLPEYPAAKNCDLLAYIRRRE